MSSPELKASKWQKDKRFQLFPRLPATSLHKSRICGVATPLCKVHYANRSPALATPAPHCGFDIIAGGLRASFMPLRGARSHLS